MHYYWLSFCDPARPCGEQFLGVAIVRATTMLEACAAAHLLGCNPGGEVQGVEIPIDFEIPSEYVERLLSLEEIDALDAALGSYEW